MNKLVQLIFPRVDFKFLFFGPFSFNFPLNSQNPLENYVEPLIQRLNLQLNLETGADLREASGWQTPRRTIFSNRTTLSFSKTPYMTIGPRLISRRQCYSLADSKFVLPSSKFPIGRRVPSEGVRERAPASRKFGLANFPI